METLRLSPLFEEKRNMKQRRLYQWIHPYKVRTWSNRAQMKIALSITLILALFVIPDSYSKELGKKTEMKSETAVIVPADNQSTGQIKPVKSEQTQLQSAPAISEKGTQIKWQVLSGGGITGNSSSYQMGNSVSQTAVGYGSSSLYKLCQGFLPGSYEAGFIRGDATGDGVIDVGDIVYLINYLFKTGSAPTPLQAGDVNCDGNVDVGDVVYLINYLFKGGPPPNPL